MRQFSSGVVAAAAGRTEAFVPLCESAYARRQINEQITHNTMQWQWKRRAAVTCDLSEKFALGCEILKQCYRLTQPPPAGVQREPGNTEGATLKDGVAACMSGLSRCHSLFCVHGTLHFLLAGSAYPRF